jgi:Mor family transcriptional regulator
MSGTIKTHKEIKAIIADYKKGMPILEISRKHNHSYSGIYTILEKHNIPRRSYRRRSRLYQNAHLVVCDYLKGLIYRQITKKYNISEPDIIIILKETGTPKRGRPKKRPAISLTFENIRCPQ